MTKIIWHITMSVETTGALLGGRRWWDGAAAPRIPRSRSSPTASRRPWSPRERQVDLDGRMTDLRYTVPKSK